MEDLLTELTREVRSRYYGKYRGYVVDNRDPEQRGRLRVAVPAVLGETASAWALPCLPFGGKADQGLFAIPEQESIVWVEFEAGDLHHPIWSGVFWQQSSDVPAEAQTAEPTTRIFKTPSGHCLQFDDASGQERFRLYHPTQAEMTIDENGSVTVSDAKGSKVTLDASAGKLVAEDQNGNRMTMDAGGIKVEDKNGNTIEMAASGITLKAQQIVLDAAQVMLGGQGGEPLIKGQSLLTLLATHVHTTTAPGSPTSPPIPQGEMSTLSTSVTSR